MDRDAILEITISDDRMTAFGTFLPPLGAGRLFSPEYVDAVLENHGIVYGVLHDAIAEAMLACNTERRAKEEIVVARGTEPIAERPEYWEIENPPRESTGESDPAALRVDYKGMTKIDVVLAGDRVAVKVPAAEGTVGYDLFGTELPFQTQSVSTRQPGRQTRVTDDAVYADVGGQLIVTNTEFYVDDRLEISGDVGFQTGSIEFPGDVVVKGEIKEGFHIWAGKGVVADRTVDVSEIYCRGDFFSAGGIIGRGKALLRAGGSVHVRFVGNCHVESKSSISVQQYAYHGRIGTLGSFSMEKSGRVIGGVITAVDGIACNKLGNPAGVRTCARAGIDFIAERKLRLTREKHQAIALRLQKLTNKLGENPSDRQLDIVYRLEEARNRYAKMLSALTESLDRNESAEIVVTGEVFPGAYVQICRAEYIVTEKMKAVRFYLEKETGRVIPAPIKKDEGGSASHGETSTTTDGVEAEAQPDTTE